MGNSLAEYAALHPEAQAIPDTDREAQAARAAQTAAARERTAETQEAESLKYRITQQLERGTPPELILSTAIACIGLLTHDREWAQAGQQSIGTIYADLAQQSFILDNATTEADRLRDQQDRYRDKLRGQLERQMKELRKIEYAIAANLTAITPAYQPEDTDQ